MDKKLFKNYIYNILYQTIKIFLSLVVVPYTMGHLGESVIGVSDFANNIAIWFLLIGTLGINVYGKREIAKVRDNKEDLSRTFFEIAISQYVNMGIALVLYILYSTVAVEENQVIFYLHILTVLSAFFDITWFYFGIENFFVVALRNILIKIAGVILTFTLLHGPEDLWLFVVINSGTDLIGHLFTYFGLKKYVHFVPFDFLSSYKKHIRASFALFIPTIALNMYTMLDQTMLGFLVSDKGEVAIYKVAQSFVNNFLFFTTAIGNIMLPRIANIYHKDNQSEEVGKYINATFNIALLLGIPMMVAIACVASSFISWYLPNQLKIITLLQVLSPLVLFASIADVFGIQYLVPTGRNRGYTISVVAGALINIVANFILIPKLESVGASLGSVIAQISVAVIQYTYVRKKIRIKGTTTFIKSLIASALMGVAVVLIGNIFEPSLVVNGIQALAGFVVYIAALVIMKEELLLQFVKSIIGKVKPAN